MIDTGTLAVALIFGLPVIAVITAHQRKVLEMKLRLRETSTESPIIEELRAEISALRDTATRYDLSFDASLQRIEERVGALERRMGSSAEQPIAQHTDRG